MSADTALVCLLPCTDLAHMRKVDLARTLRAVSVNDITRRNVIDALAPRAGLRVTIVAATKVAPTWIDDVIRVAVASTRIDDVIGADTRTSAGIGPLLLSQSPRILDPARQPVV